MPKQSPSAVPSRPRFLTLREAAELLNVSIATLARWACERRGPAFVKLCEGEAGSVRYPLDLIDAFIADRLKPPKDAAPERRPK